MVLILGPGIDPELRWARWEAFEGHPEAILSYFVRLEKSEYNLYFCCFTKPGVGQVQQSFKASDSGTDLRRSKYWGDLTPHHSSRQFTVDFPY